MCTYEPTSIGPRLCLGRPLAFLDGKGLPAGQDNPREGISSPAESCAKRYRRAQPRKNTHRTTTTQKPNTTTMKKLLILAGLAAALPLAGVQAQYSFTSVGQTITETFTSYAGTTMPTNWSTLSFNGTATQNANLANIAFRGGNTGLTNGSGGIYSMGTTVATSGGGANTNRMLGVVGNGNLPNAFALVATYDNNTGSTITQLSISYAAGQWYAQQARLNFFTVQYSVNGGAWQTVTSLTYNAAFNAFDNSTNTGYVNASNGNSGSLPSNSSIGGRTGLNGFLATGEFNGNAATLSSGTFTLATPWTAGTNIRIAWVYDNVGSAGNGARQLLAIDDVSVTAIPEPNVVALFTVCGIATTIFLRRRLGKSNS